MNDEHRTDSLSEALHRLEPRPASPGFTQRVLSRLEARDLARARRRRTVRVVLTVQAALVALIVTLALTLRSRPEPSISSSTARAEEIRRQHRLLEEELERLRKARDQRSAVLYLGDTEGYDLVLDLDPLLEQDVDTPRVPAMQDLRVRPALVSDDGRRRP